MHTAINIDCHKPLLIAKIESTEYAGRCGMIGQYFGVIKHKNGLSRVIRGTTSNMKVKFWRICC